MEQEDPGTFPEGRLFRDQARDSKHAVHAMVCSMMDNHEINQRTLKRIVLRCPHELREKKGNEGDLKDYVDNICYGCTRVRFLDVRMLLLIN